MNEVTLVIPAKDEPNALPIVLDELKKFDPTFKIIIVITLLWIGLWGWA